LVGDEDYYARFGFTPAGPTGIYMPGEPKRLMVRALVADGLAGVQGRVRRWKTVRRRLRAA
jgi:predicted N-acetyltransferase YhbS